VQGVYIGISRPSLDPMDGWLGLYYGRDCTDGWFMGATDGTLWGNGKEDGVKAGFCEQGDRVGVLLDLGGGSLRFFKNGVQHGPGYAAGSVAGPVVAAAQTMCHNKSVRLLPNAQQPK
jgi:hypothetical protein